MLMCAAIIGDNVGYFLGQHAGPRIFSRPQSSFFHPDHLRRTRDFYEKHGAARRRLCPLHSDHPHLYAVHLGRGRDALCALPPFSLFGGALWIAFMTTLGYQLGHIDLVRRNFEKVVLGVIFVSLLPVFPEAFKAWRTAAAGLTRTVTP